MAVFPGTLSRRNPSNPCTDKAGVRSTPAPPDSVQPTSLLFDWCLREHRGTEGQFAASARARAAKKKDEIKIRVAQGHN